MPENQIVQLIVAVTVVICVTILQLYAWQQGYNGAISQLLGIVFGALLTYFFKHTAVTKK